MIAFVRINDMRRRGTTVTQSDRENESENWGRSCR